MDEFHVRGASISAELATSLDLAGKKVLDVGSGLGGPARMLADTYQCEVTGIDLSATFVRTATQLSELVGLSDRTTFLQGDATELPFDSNSFDLVWTQHVQMNVQDKMAFYSEIKRVLKPQGYFIHYEIFRQSEAPIPLPMPWASEAKHSFLAHPSNAIQFLQFLGFEILKTKDETAAGIQFFEQALEQLRISGPGPLGLHLLMGEHTELKLRNLFQSLKEGHLTLQSGLFQLK